MSRWIGQTGLLHAYLSGRQRKYFNTTNHRPTHTLWFDGRFVPPIKIVEYASLGSWHVSDCPVPLLNMSQANYYWAPHNHQSIGSCLPPARAIEEADHLFVLRTERSSSIARTKSPKLRRLLAAGSQSRTRSSKMRVTPRMSIWQHIRCLQPALAIRIRRPGRPC
ncbi:hypothetical protein CPC08DRAFT_21209 [Agrocybe pediades]|nr:hypothetical protein CPC08DRAFT_21209 [Agrocybe pediades]